MALVKTPETTAWPPLPQPSATWPDRFGSFWRRFWWLMHKKNREHLCRIEDVSETGFTIHTFHSARSDGEQRIAWKAITTATAYKSWGWFMDVLLEFQLENPAEGKENESIVLNEDFPGFQDLLRGCAQYLPGFHTEWQDDVIHPIKQPNRTTVFVRDSADEWWYRGQKYDACPPELQHILLP